MKNIYKIGLFSTSAFIISAFTFINTNWNIDPNYSIKFSGNKAEGTFSGLAGTISFNPNDLAKASIHVVVNANTIKTGNSLKDKHAKDEDWFDVAKYPYIKFTSTSFVKSGSTTIVSGSLDLHGTKK